MCMCVCVMSLDNDVLGVKPTGSPSTDDISSTDDT